MKKRKDYLRLFLNYAKNNDLWFSVYGNGGIDEVTDTLSYMDILPPHGEFILGTKETYEWLVRAHKESQEE